MTDASKKGEEMGFLGLFKHRKESLKAAPAAEEPEFLKEIEDTVIPKGTVREEVEPELALWLSNGTTARNLKELASALKRMSAKYYKEHVSEERNEIAEWAQEILNDEELARQLRKARSKLRAAQCVEKRIKQLKAAKKSGKKAVKVEVKAKEQAPETQEEIIPITEMPLPVETRKTSFSVWPFKRKKQEQAAEETLAQLPEIPPFTEETKSPELPLPEIPVEEPETAEAQPEQQQISVEEQPAQDELVTAEETEAMPEKQPKKPRHGKKSEEEAALEIKEQELEAAEKELDVEEDRLNKKRLEMTRKRYDLIKQKGEIEREKFELFMKKQKLSKQKEEILMDSQSLGIEPAKEMKGMPDFRLAGAYGKERLEALLEEAKQHIRENNVEQARNALQEVQSVLSSTFMPSSEKKQLEYEILEVEADLKLASLN